MQIHISFLAIYEQTKQAETIKLPLRCPKTREWKTFCNDNIKK